MEVNVTMSIEDIGRQLRHFDWLVAQPDKGEDFDMLSFLSNLGLIEISYPDSEGYPYVKKNQYYNEIIKAYTVRKAVEKMVAANIL
jgi:hypothetical protein